MLYLTLFGPKEYVKMTLNHVTFVLETFEFWSIAARVNMLSTLFNIHVCGIVWPHVFSIALRLKNVLVPQSLNFLKNLFI